MASVFLLLVLLPVMFYIWIGTIISLFKKQKDKKNQSYHIDSRVKDEERRINEWGLDDDWRWGKL